MTTRARSPSRLYNQLCATGRQAGTQHHPEPSSPHIHRFLARKGWQDSTERLRIQLRFCFLKLVFPQFSSCFTYGMCSTGSKFFLLALPDNPSHKTLLPAAPISRPGPADHKGRETTKPLGSGMSDLHLTATSSCVSGAGWPRGVGDHTCPLLQVPQEEQGVLFPMDHLQ